MSIIARIILAAGLLANMVIPGRRSGAAVLLPAAPLATGRSGRIAPR